MAYTTITFENPKTGAVKMAPAGFSWTTFFFGFLPTLFRGHWGGAALQLILAFCTMGLSTFVFMFMYNKMYITHLRGEGFQFKSCVTFSKDALEARLGLVLG